LTAGSLVRLDVDTILIVDRNLETRASLAIDATAMQEYDIPPDQDLLAALKQGVTPGTISSDVHQFNVNGPVFDLATTLSKFLHLGLTLDEVIQRASTNPATAPAPPRNKPASSHPPARVPHITRPPPRLITRVPTSVRPAFSHACTVQATGYLR